MFENKRPLCREQYNICTDTWKQKTLCVENNTIFTQYQNCPRIGDFPLIWSPLIWMISQDIHMTLNNISFIFLKCAPIYFFVHSTIGSLGFQILFAHRIYINLLTGSVSLHENAHFVFYFRKTSMPDRIMENEVIHCLFTKTKSRT